VGKSLSFRHSVEALAMLSTLITAMSLLAPAWPFLSSTADRPAGLNKETFAKIKIGMTQAEVEAIVGQEPHSRIGTGALEACGVREAWNDGDKSIEVWMGFDLTTPKGCLGKVQSATYRDDSTSPPLVLGLRSQQ
jgi:hypothetical protein